MISFKNVHYAYRKDGDLALNDISLEILKNEWVAIVGHNGSGKSTLAKLMNGLLLPTKGEIVVNNIPLNEKTYWDIRSHVGMVFQNPENQFVGTMVMDDVAFGLENAGVPREEMIERVESALQKVGMEAYKTHAPHRLSGGQKQKVAIAGVLAIAPDVIIFDEATAMLDPKGREELIETIVELRKQEEMTIITITHDLREVVHADRVVVLENGRVLYDQTPQELFKDPQKLIKTGLEAPFVSRVVEGFKQAGYELSLPPLDHDELVEQLWKFNSKT